MGSFLAGNTIRPLVRIKDCGSEEQSSGSSDSLLSKYHGLIPTRLPHWSNLRAVFREEYPFIQARYADPFSSVTGARSWVDIRLVKAIQIRGLKLNFNPWTLELVIRRSCSIVRREKWQWVCYRESTVDSEIRNSAIHLHCFCGGSRIEILEIGSYTC